MNGDCPGCWNQPHYCTCNGAPNKYSDRMGSGIIATQLRAKDTAEKIISNKKSKSKTLDDNIKENNNQAGTKNWFKPSTGY